MLRSFPIAFDISEGDVFVVQCKPLQSGHTVTGFARRELGNALADLKGGGNGFLSILKDILAHGSFSGKRVSLHLPGSDVFSFPMEVKPEANESLEEAIARQAAGHLPFPIEEAVLDYLPCGTGPDQARHAKVIGLAAQRETVNRYLDVFKRLGYTVEVIDAPVSSLHRLHKHLFPADEAQTVLLCNVGPTQSTCALLSNGVTVSQHQIPWGARKLYGKILSDLALPGEPRRARLLMQRYGLAHDSVTPSDLPEDDDSADGDASKARTIYHSAVSSVDELVNELNMILSFSDSVDQVMSIQKICLYGEAQYVRGLDRYVESRLALSIPTSLVNPADRIGISGRLSLPEDCALSSFSLALGLSMRTVSWL